MRTLTMVRDIEPPISNVHNIYGFCFRIWASDVLILENLENQTYDTTYRRDSNIDSDNKTKWTEPPSAGESGVHKQIRGRYEFLAWMVGENGANKSQWFLLQISTQGEMLAKPAKEWTAQDYSTWGDRLGECGKTTPAFLTMRRGRNSEVWQNNGIVCVNSTHWLTTGTRNYTLTFVNLLFLGPLPVLPCDPLFNSYIQTYIQTYIQCIYLYLNAWGYIWCASMMAMLRWGFNGSRNACLTS